MGVRDADAEAEGPHLSGFEDAIPERHQHAERERHEHERDQDRATGVGDAKLVDGEREGLRSAGQVPGERDRRPELSERPGPREDEPGRELGAKERKGDAPKRVPA